MLVRLTNERECILFLRFPLKQTSWTLALRQGKSLSFNRKLFGCAKKWSSVCTAVSFIKKKTLKLKTELHWVFWCKAQKPVPAA